MNTTENNKLIAEFMGLKPKTESPNLYTYSDSPWYSIRENNPEKVMEGIVNYVKYATDWNWLMEVVEKIFSLDEYYHFKQTLGQFDTGIRDRFPNKKGVYDACVEFIKWYNKQKQLENEK
jgi:hypothetical protein